MQVLATASQKDSLRGLHATPRHLAPVESAEDPRILATAAELSRLAAETSLELCARLADVLIRNLYGGDASLWRSRKTKGVTLRAIASEPSVPFSAATLYRALAINERIQMFGGLKACAGLTASHFRATLGLPWDDAERQLARARADKLTVPEMIAERHHSKGDGAMASRRRIVPRAILALRSIERRIRVGDLDIPTAAAELDPADADEAARRLPKLIRRLQQLHRAVADIQEV